jgi:hypothetical protein
MLSALKGRLMRLIAGRRAYRERRDAGAAPRIVVVMPYFLPDRAGSSAMHCDLWFSLAERGFEVTVRCPIPYFPEWRDKSGRNGWRRRTTREHGTTVERFGLFIPSNPNSVMQRMLFEASMFLSMLRNLRGGGFSAVVAYSPNAACVGYAAVLKLIWRMPMWLHVLDVTSDAAIGTGLVKHRGLTRLFQTIERRLYNRADVWSTISAPMATRLSAIRTRGQPIFLQPNWVEPSLMAAIVRTPPTDVRTGPCRLLYVGNIGAKQGLLTFCQWLHGSELAFSFSIFGHGARAREVRNWLAAQNDPRFHLGEEFLDDADYARALAAADLYAICEVAGAGAAYFPGKAVVAIQAQTPILAICAEDSALGAEVTEHDLGLRASWDDLTQAAALIGAIRDHDDRLARWRRNCASRAGFYDRAANIERFAERLRTLVSSGDFTARLEEQTVPVAGQVGGSARYADCGAHPLRR